MPSISKVGRMLVATIFAMITITPTIIVVIADRMIHDDSDLCAIDMDLMLLDVQVLAAGIAGMNRVRASYLGSSPECSKKSPNRRTGAAIHDMIICF